MNFFEKFLHSVAQYTMTTPKNYGWFHLIFLFITLFATIGVCIWFYRHPSDIALRRFLFICWIVIALLEIGKQLVFSFSLNPETQEPTWDYQWYAFPFQLCSSPLCLLLFAAFLREGKARQGVCTFLATFSLFGGIVVFFYPNDVFISIVFINVQTMIHHGIQIIVGVLLLSYYRQELNLKRFSYGLVTYAVIIATAMILNWVVPHFTDETFNMFYISPYFPCTLPILSTLYSLVPYPIFLLIYLLGFSAIAIGILYASKGITKAIRKASDSIQANMDIKRKSHKWKNSK